MCGTVEAMASRRANGPRAPSAYWTAICSRLWALCQRHPPRRRRSQAIDAGRVRLRQFDGTLTGDKVTSRPFGGRLHFGPAAIDHVRAQSMKRAIRRRIHGTQEHCRGQSYGHERDMGSQRTTFAYRPARIGSVIGDRRSNPPAYRRKSPVHDRIQLPAARRGSASCFRIVQGGQNGDLIDAVFLSQRAQVSRLPDPAFRKSSVPATARGEPCRRRPRHRRRLLRARAGQRISRGRGSAATSHAR